MLPNYKATARHTHIHTLVGERIYCSLLLLVLAAAHTLLFSLSLLLLTDQQECICWMPPSPFSLLLLLCVICASLLSCSHLTYATMSAATYEAKIAPALLEAIQEDVTVEANIMVQLESPEEVMQRVCADADGASRAQKTTCMVDSMQKFADDAQEEVKQLLEREVGKYERSTFFWINNSVSVRKAQGSLILEIAKLETVLTVRAEEIFYLQGKGSSGSKTKKPATMSFGFQEA